MINPRRRTIEHALVDRHHLRALNCDRGIINRRVDCNQSTTVRTGEANRAIVVGARLLRGLCSTSVLRVHDRVTDDITADNCKREKRAKNPN